LQLSTGRVSNS